MVLCLGNDIEKPIRSDKLDGQNAAIQGLLMGTGKLHALRHLVRQPAPVYTSIQRATARKLEECEAREGRGGPIYMFDERIHAAEQTKVMSAVSGRAVSTVVDDMVVSELVVNEKVVGEVAVRCRCRLEYLAVSITSLWTCNSGGLCQVANIGELEGSCIVRFVKEAIDVGDDTLESRHQSPRPPLTPTKVHTWGVSSIYFP